MVRTLLGRRSDWRIVRPRAIRRPRVTVALLGPALVAASVLVGWPAFADATGEGSVSLGLFVGASSIVLMAWTFLLALRLRWLEPVFGGLDRMYRVHRWAGSLAVVAMFLHTSLEPEIDGGIRGATERLADSAQELAGVAEIMLYVLVGVSLLRWLPYRYWRWTHKLLGVPFVFASAHFFTAEKPYANGSGWGWWFGAWMVLGTAAYVWRLAVGDGIANGVAYDVVEARRTPSSVELRLLPTGVRRVRPREGQFAFIRVQLPGLREPHPFTIASSATGGDLRFMIRTVGDWSQRLHRTDPLVGTRVLVDGPYGRFRPGAAGRPMLWVAGGVGITPFLAAIGGLPSEAPEADRPVLVYCVGDRADALAIAEVESAAAAGRIRLSLHVSAEGSRLDATRLATIAGRADLRGVHVAVCGPAALVNAVVRASERLGAIDIQHEDFDLRQGFGPDLSLPIDQLTHDWRSAR
ncbi:MAG: ferric reductase-like transmembrane domain-containing protein [Actinomycetota bacterium]|nr:ferric reductase-like transmembrane domain-containing protein [Actinomycetota bacterium]